jgi:hypothetical protein
MRFYGIIRDGDGCPKFDGDVDALPRDYAMMLTDRDVVLLWKKDHTIIEKMGLNMRLDQIRKELVRMVKNPDIGERHAAAELAAAQALIRAGEATDRSNVVPLPEG